tara:strand:+ start:1419 stop:1781 length:363 start_codon:yes stop_codon:yes gene_type:complete
MLNSPFFYIVLGCFSLLIIDAAGSVLSRKLNFNYAWFTIVTIIIYSIISIKISTISSDFNGIISGSFLGLVDGTIGVFIAKNLKPNIGNLEDFSWEITPGMTAAMLFFGSIVSTIAILIF